MEFETVQTLAGFVSTAIFVSSKVPMLAKALRTRDLHSYSIGHLGLSTGGNLTYWLYVVSLPLGPIWLLQGFFTLADLLMLSLYVVYEFRGRKAGIEEDAHKFLAAQSPETRTCRSHEGSGRNFEVVPLWVNTAR